MQSDRLSNLDVFRALAALAVCLFHFNRKDFFLGGDILRYGHLGVDVFFVISGFVIPFSLLRSEYKLVDMRAFLASRFVRLYPAYFVSGIVAVSLLYFSALVPGFRGEQPSFTAAQIISNIFLLCDFTNTHWLIPVFWTLAIEAQYYLLIAISFPLIFKSIPAVRRVVMAGWIFAPLIVGVGPTVFSWTALFVLGITIFLWREKRIRMTEFLLIMLLAAFVHGAVKGALSASVGVIAACVVAFAPAVRSAPLVWLGMISYSLYLIHVPFGGRLINFAERLPDVIWIRVLIILVALLGSIAISAVFYSLIEKPSHAFSRDIQKRLKTKAKKAMTPTPVAVTPRADARAEPSTSVADL